MQKPLAALALAAAAAALAGCPNPNLYSTPRTVAPGSFAHTIALEALGYEGDIPIPDDPKTPQNETAVEHHRAGSPLPPSYQLRLGLLSDIDAGIQIRNLSSPGVDFKWNPLRGFFDLALDPGIQYMLIGNTNTTGESVTAHVFYFHAPVLLGINPTSWLSVVAVPGFSYGLDLGELAGDNLASTVRGPLFRGSLGMQFRIWENFAVHPEASVLKRLDGPGFAITGGVGFNFGSIPGFDDRK